jgi:hypothetical protein
MAAPFIGKHVYLSIDYCSIDAMERLDERQRDSGFFNSPTVTYFFDD